MIDIFSSWALPQPVTLFISDGYFIGSAIGVAAKSGTAKIINCSFQQISTAIYVYYARDFIIKHSKIKNNGIFNGPFPSHYLYNNQVRII